MGVTLNDSWAYVLVWIVREVVGACAPYGCPDAGSGALVSVGVEFVDEAGVSAVEQGGPLNGFSGFIPIEQGEGVTVSADGAEG